MPSQGRRPCSSTEVRRNGPAAQPRGSESPSDASAALSTQPITGIKLWLGDGSPYTLDTPREVLAYLLGQSFAAQQKIVIIEITKGSIIVELEMSEEDVLRLVAAFAETSLDHIHVEAIRLPPTTGPLAAGLRQIVHLPNTPNTETTDPVTPELTLTRTPDQASIFAVTLSIPTLPHINNIPLRKLLNLTHAGLSFIFAKRQLRIVFVVSVLALLVSLYTITVYNPQGIAGSACAGIAFVAISIIIVMIIGYVLD